VIEALHQGAGGMRSDPFVATIEYTKVVAAANGLLDKLKGVNEFVSVRRGLLCLLVVVGQFLRFFPGLQVGA
jgi:hypothetical protein